MGENGNGNGNGKLVRWLVAAIIMLSLTTAGIKVADTNGILRALFGVPPVSEQPGLRDDNNRTSGSVYP